MKRSPTCRKWGGEFHLDRDGHQSATSIHESAGRLQSTGVSATAAASHLCTDQSVPTTTRTAHRCSVVSCGPGTCHKSTSSLVCTIWYWSTLYMDWTVGSLHSFNPSSPIPVHDFSPSLRLWPIHAILRVLYMFQNPQYHTRARNACIQCGELYPLPQGATSWRCRKCGKFNDLQPGCCIVL